LDGFFLKAIVPGRRAIKFLLGHKCYVKAKVIIFSTRSFFISASPLSKKECNSRFITLCGFQSQSRTRDNAEKAFEKGKIEKYYLLRNTILWSYKLGVLYNIILPF
jgi:hypothetical protein